jgi:predicted DNA-binding protein (MmcQ/YjbR family)
MAHPLEVIRTEAEKYPEAQKAFLFGDHEVYRVKQKVFVWLGEGDAPGSTYVSVKLKDTQGMALSLPFVTPSGYGMAKYGWIDANFPKGKFPDSLVREWILESYRHTAPKRLLARLDGSAEVARGTEKKAKKTRR